MSDINERAATLVNLPWLATEAIANTAQRLGVDPVAFAEACQDGKFLYEAVLLVGNKLPRTVAEHQILDRWLDKLAALKRAEPGHD